ncbi:hypothetical protein K2Z83_01505 [Oscillochloris sp. ZM17-4]|uniref:hypothetical protein n=1 Tax=Oscillochloris sp. ZM17-4 TaxID=2866714 RepID=UPI001C73B0E2|nr:hypothetical protein [Oscillochloris sp. ZM17-4]MBX0326369.1 hypothetical protein [Oscillochloris sp. ZM17-4]
MKKLSALALTAATGVALWQWFERETLREGEATVYLQSEHEHFHLHVDLPPGMEIQPGDTLEIVDMPKVPSGQTQGEMSYRSPVKLFKASWLRRTLIKRSSLVEVNELVEHP